MGVDGRVAVCGGFGRADEAENDRGKRPESQSCHGCSPRRREPTWLDTVSQKFQKPKKCHNGVTWQGGMQN